jgi:hypothetical protein
MDNNTKKFLEDIGLGRKEVQEDNLLHFLSSVSIRMDNPDAALATHIKNLVYTYGIEKVTEAITRETALNALENDDSIWELK